MISTVVLLNPMNHLPKNASISNQGESSLHVFFSLSVTKPENSCVYFAFLLFKREFFRAIYDDTITEKKKFRTVKSLHITVANSPLPSINR